MIFISHSSRDAYARSIALDDAPEALGKTVDEIFSDFLDKTYSAARLNQTRREVLERYEQRWCEKFIESLECLV